MTPIPVEARFSNAKMRVVLSAFTALQWTVVPALDMMAVHRSDLTIGQHLKPNKFSGFETATASLGRATPYMTKQYGQSSPRSKCLQKHSLSR